MQIMFVRFSHDINNSGKFLLLYNIRLHECTSIYLLVVLVMNI